MAAGWQDCPALGPGWQWQQVLRKSGATRGRTDIYYKSPTGVKFRSKAEISRFLGPGQNMENFDFRHGLVKPGSSRGRRGPKWCLPTGPPPAPMLKSPPPSPPMSPPTSEEQVGGAEETLPLPALKPPPPPEAPQPPEPPQEWGGGCCAGCQSLFPGVMLPSQGCWLCPSCCGQKWDCNQEQQFLKVQLKLAEEKLQWQQERLEQRLEQQEQQLEQRLEQWLHGLEMELRHLRNLAQELKVKPGRVWGRHTMGTPCRTPKITASLLPHGNIHVLCHERPPLPEEEERQRGLEQHLPFSHGDEKVRVLSKLEEGEEL